MTLKFLRFWYADFWNLITFHLYWQYAHQMKAEIILNSYLLSKSIIVYEIFWKNWISKFLASIFEGKKISIAKFWKKIFYNPPIFFPRRYPERSGKQSKLFWADSTLPPTLFRVKTVSKVQKTSSILKVGFALSNWPHFNSVYLLRVPSLTGIAV